MLLVTRCWLNSVPRSSVAHLYSLLADQLSLLCSLLATRLIVLRSSRSSTYVALGILLPLACYTSTFLPVILTEDISYSPVAAPCLLHASPFVLLTTYYSLLPLCCLLADYCLALLLLACWTPSFSLLAPHRSPHVCSMLTTCESLLHSGSSRLTVRFFLFSTRR